MPRDGNHLHDFPQSLFPARPEPSSGCVRLSEPRHAGGWRPGAPRLLGPCPDKWRPALAGDGHITYLTILPVGRRASPFTRQLRRVGLWDWRRGAGRKGRDLICLLPLRRRAGSIQFATIRPVSASAERHLPAMPVYSAPSRRLTRGDHDAKKTRILLGAGGTLAMTLAAAPLRSGARGA